MRIFYFLSEAFKSLKRNGVMTFASIAVLLSCLLVIGGFSLLVVNIDVNLEKLGTLNDIVVFCHPDASEEEIAGIENSISKLSNIESINHKTKSEQLKLLQEEDPELYGDITEEENPLSDSFTIKYEDNSKVADLNYELQLIEGVRKVRNNLELANTFETLKNNIMMIFFWFLAILFIVSVFIIINTIKLAVINRKKEISIMRYIGATGWFIILPFVFEGIIIGLVSGVTAFFATKYGYISLTGQFANDIQMLTLINFGDIQSYVLLGMLGIGVVTGVIGSSLSLVKYLKE